MVEAPALAAGNLRGRVGVTLSLFGLLLMQFSDDVVNRAVSGT
jgi:hypothetical protein